MEGWTKLAFVISDMYKCFSDDEEQQMIWLAAHISSNKKYSLVQNPKRQRWRYRDGDLLLIGYLGRQPDRDLLFFLLLPELLPPIYKYICLCPAQLQCIAPGPHDIAVVKFFPKIWVVKRAASQPSIDRKPKFPIGILTDDVGNVLF